MSIFNKILKGADMDEEVDVRFDLLSGESEVDNFASSSRGDNQVLAVWGSSGSGKTTVSVKLARYIASLRKAVVLVFADTTASALPYVCSDGDLINKKSLLNIFKSERIIADTLQKNAIRHKKNEHLLMFGLQYGENIADLDYSYEQCKNFLLQLRMSADYIIIDCTSDMLSNHLSAAALFEADAVLRVVNCDMKSQSFLESQMSILRLQNWNDNKLYKAVSGIDVSQKKDISERIIGSTDFKIAHSNEVHNQHRKGNLLVSLRQKESINFSRAIAKIANEIFLLRD